MCGIFAYIGDKHATPVLLQGLYRLEYRGYDSAGICLLDKDALHVEKRKGRIAELDEQVSPESFSATAGIAHTRWATHGAPTTINAHPHVSRSGTFAVVHNGIIENHVVLRKLLEKEGFTFVSETDSEVIAHLIEKFYEDDVLSATMQALELVDGTFGIAVISSEKREIIAARRGSPLVIGIGDEEMFVASDVAPILGHTKQVLYLEDNEIARISESSYLISDLRGKEINKEVEEISWELDQIEKSGYPHFMLKEIFEQPEALANRLSGRFSNGKLRLSADIAGVKRFIIVACGTSWHSALIGKQYIERLCRIPVEVDYASEFRYRDPVIGPGDLVIAISQSGETADTLEALRIARKRGAKTMGVVNVVGSTIAREVDSGVYLHAGPEIGVASTKAFTSQVLAMLLLAMYILQERGGEPDTDLRQELLALPETVALALELSDEIAELAEEFTQAKNFLYLGRGLNFPVALEGALKLKEISYIHAEGYPAAEMKHGPIALIDEEMPVFFIATKDATYEKVLSNMQEVKARGGVVIALASEADDELSRLADYVILVPNVREELSPIINAIPLQLFSYHVATKRGLDVDKPRNLAKSVTVE